MTFLIVSLALIVAISVYLTFFNKEKSELLDEQVTVVANFKELVEDKKEKKVLVLKQKSAKSEQKVKSKSAPKKEQKKTEKVATTKKTKAAKSSNKK